MLKNCLNCNKEFDAEPRYIKRGHAKYCSKQCASKRLRTKKVKQPNVICGYCNIPFYKQPDKLKYSKSKIYFCCRQHKDFAQKISFGLKEMWPDHFMTGYSSYREHAFSIYSHKCNVCGYDKNDNALIVHHKDSNRKNGDISNLEILCANCHCILHFSKNN